MPQNFDNIPQEEFDFMRYRLIEQIQAMDDAEFEIIAKTEASLGFFIAKALEHIALVLGYVIAIPIAWGIRFAQSIRSGLTRGWEEGFKSAGLD